MKVTDAMLGPVNQLLAMLIGSTPGLAVALEPLAGQRIGLRVQGTPIRLLLVGEAGTVRVQRWNTTDGPLPDASISGSPTALLALLRHPEQRGSARFDGRVELLADLQHRFRSLQPDWTRPLSALLGAERAERLLGEGRRSRDWLRASGDTLAQTAGEYLTEERRRVVGGAELDGFCDAVDLLRADAERFAARLRLLEAADTAGQPGSAGQ